MCPPSPPTRRAVLRALASGAGVAALPATAGATRAGTPDGTDTSTPTSTPVTPTGTEGFAPAGRLELSTATEVVVDDEGDHAYVAAGDGLTVVDVSDPATPRVAARRDRLLADWAVGPVELFNDVAVDGDRLVLAGPVAGDGISGVFVYDVSDPADPTRERFVETDHAVHNADVAGSTVYATGTGTYHEAAVAYDVATGERLGRWSPLTYDAAWGDVDTSLRNCHDVHADGDTLYCSHWDAGTWVVDASDPTAMRAVGRLGGRSREALVALDDGFGPKAEMPGNHHVSALHPDRPLLAVGHEAFDLDRTDRVGGPAGIGLWDVADPTDPERVATLRPPAIDVGGSTAHNVGWRGDRLYAAWYSGGVRVYDLSTPAEPRLLAAWRDPDDTSFWTAQPADGGFVASSHVGTFETDRPDHLYVFPEPDGEGRPAEPGLWPARNDVTPTPTATATPAPFATRTRSPTPSRTASASPPPSESASTSASTDDTTTASPGFGAAGALAAGALALARRLRN